VVRNRASGKQITLLMACLVALAACAGSEPVNPSGEARIEEIAKSIGCTSDEVAVCIEVDCKPEDYYCAAREDVRKMFKAGEFRHR